MCESNQQSEEVKQMDEERYVDQGMGVESCEVLPFVAIEPEPSEAETVSLLWSKRYTSLSAAMQRHRIHTGMTLALIRAIRKCDPSDGISRLLDNHEAFARELYQEQNVLTVADHD